MGLFNEEPPRCRPPTKEYIKDRNNLGKTEKSVRVPTPDERPDLWGGKDDGFCNRMNYIDEKKRGRR